ncbi:MAG TPA: DUF1326 domain-containing protein [Gaiellaceae bacterium]|jgi:hypothetical protein|nr:DUF1326 domain-containing protein [Gaiellaceae bacterium]
MSKWHLKGTVYIACNCDYGCPCNFNARPSTGECEGEWLWHVDEGAFDGVSLDGLAWTVTSDWPGAIHEGGGRAVCLYDERADEDQRHAIEELVRGGHGGPWGTFINTYDLEAVRPEPFRIDANGFATKIAVGDGAFQLEYAPIANPVTGAEVHPGAVLPEGLVCKEMSFGTSTTFVVDNGISYDHSGRYTAIAPFDYTSS